MPLAGLCSGEAGNGASEGHYVSSLALLFLDIIVHWVPHLKYLFLFDAASSAPMT